MTHLQGQALHDAIDALEAEFSELILMGADDAIVDAVLWAIKTCHPTDVLAAQEHVRAWRSTDDAETARDA